MPSQQPPRVVESFVSGICSYRCELLYPRLALYEWGKKERLARTGKRFVPCDLRTSSALQVPQLKKENSDVEINLIRNKTEGGLESRAVYISRRVALGLQITVSPSALTYNAVMFKTSNPKSVLVTNSGSAAITFGTASVSGADAGDFAVSTDTCSNHTIAPLKRCKIALKFSALLPVGSAESALLSINDNLGNALQTVPLTGNVVRGSVRTTLSGLNVTIINPTNNQYSAEWSTTGP